MSSACVCHLELRVPCFYCEVYTPLKDRHESLRAKVELLIADYESSARSTARMLDDHPEAPIHHRFRVEGKNEAYRDFTRYLREILDDESTT